MKKELIEVQPPSYSEIHKLRRVYYVVDMYEGLTIVTRIYELGKGMFLIRLSTYYKASYQKVKAFIYINQ